MSTEDTAELHQFQRKVASLVPSVFRRTILLAVTQLYVLNCHPTIIFPSLCNAKTLTEPLNQFPILNVLSLVPSLFKRIIPFAVTQLYVLNHHPTIILPSFWMVIACTDWLNPSHILKVLSLVPSVFIRTILFAVIQLYTENCPPAITLPSFCIAMALT